MLAEPAGKRCLAQLGIKVPEGALAQSVAEAAAIAKRIGYPVVLKAQAAALGHRERRRRRDAQYRRRSKSGVDAVNGKRFWRPPKSDVEGISGAMERMMAPGLEMIVGAKRDPDWGPVVLVGLGGIWIEALNDACVLPPGLPEGLILEELNKLKASKLLHGSRGMAPVDCAAVAHTVSVIGQLMLARPKLKINEVDINPLVVYPKGTRRRSGCHRRVACCCFARSEAGKRVFQAVW